MAFRIRNVTAYGPIAGLRWIQHLFIGWKRTLLGEARDKYLDQLIQRGLPVLPVEGSRKNCTICGYAQARLRLEHGLNLQGCSMTVIPNALASDKLSAWADKVAQKDRSSEPLAETHLQTASQ